MLERQESKPQAGQTRINKPLKQIEPLALFTGQTAGSPDTLKGAPDAQHLRPVLQQQPRVTF